MPMFDAVYPGVCGGWSAGARAGTTVCPVFYMCSNVAALGQLEDLGQETTGATRNN